MELLVRKKTVKRRSYLYAGEVRVYEFSIEIMLITSLILLLLFFTAVSTKHHYQKALKAHKHRSGASALTLPVNKALQNVQAKAS